MRRERITIDVGAQYVTDALRLAVRGTGTDEAGPYALVMIGSYPDVDRVRLRAGVPHPLPRGGELRLAATSSEGFAASVALEVVLPDSSGGSERGERA